MKTVTQFWKRLAGIALLLMVFGAIGQAEVGLMLDEALKFDSSKWTGEGHAAVYLSGVCIVSPVELRLCGPGENGVVLSTYRRLGENQSYEWNAAPLNIYLYGVEDEADRPLYATPTIRWILEQRYREKYLGSLCTGACVTNPHALWRESVAMTFLRDIYMFSVKSTPEQDRGFVEKFNRAANIGRYNGMTHNCADFARAVVNTYFPGAAKPDRINDFGMTGPKAIAKSFARYGMKHPELDFHVVRFTQIPGEYPASKDNRKGTEELFHANRWRLPMALLTPYELAAFTSTYIITGRFNPEMELQRRPTAQVTKSLDALRQAQSEGDQDGVKRYKQQIRSERAESLGTAEEWSGYVSSLRQYEDEALERGYVSDLGSFRNLAQRTVSQSWISMDKDGALWLRPRDGKSIPKVGLSANSLQQSPSDLRLGYLLTLSRLDAELRRKPKNRETLGHFREDWELMERLHGRMVPLTAGTRHTESRGGAAQ